MQNLVYGHKHRLVKRCGIALLILAHLALTTPLPEVEAMESDNYKINESAMSSGRDSSTTSATKVPYSSIGEPAAGNVKSQNYKLAIGYINTIASNPPVFTEPIPNTEMRLLWNKGEANNNAFDLDDYFSSPDNSTLTYTVEGASSIIVDIDTTSQTSHMVSFSQDATFFGFEKVRFIATDAVGNRTKSNYVVLVVKDSAQNNPPVIHPITDITADETDLVSITPVIFDPDTGDTLTTTFTAPFKDDGTWQTTYDDAGSYTVTATVSDGSLTDSESFTVKVTNLNRPPEIDPIPNITVDEGELVKLNVTTRDLDGDNVIVTYPTPFDAKGAWQTSYSDHGDYQFTITATDGDLTTQAVFNLTVNNINAAPNISITSDKSNVSPGDDFIITVLAEDPDGDELSLTLKQDGSVIPGYENIDIDPLDSTYSTGLLSIDSTGNHTIEAVVVEVDPQGTNNTPPNSYDLNTKLLLHFDGDFDDESANDHIATNTGVDINTSIKKFGSGSVYFDGDETDELTVPDHADWDFSGDFTIDTWLYPTSYPSGTYVCLNNTNYTATEAGFMFYAGGDARFSIIATTGEGSWDIAQVTSGTTGLALNTWSHIAVVRSGSTFYLFVNGTNVANTTTSTNTAITSSQTLQIGRGDDPDAKDHTFRGYIDELRISNSARWTENFAVPNGPHQQNAWRYSDSLIINVEESSSPDEYFPLSGDFNGDGLTDLGYYNREFGTWKVALSDNGAFGAFEYWINGGFGENNQWFYPLTGDFDGGGKTDVAFTRVPTSIDWLNASYIKLAISNGAGFDVQNGRWRQSDNIDLQSNWEYTTLTGDFNGDGLTDIGQINVKQNRRVSIGITKANLRPDALSEWGSSISITDFAPMAGDFNGDGLTDLCFYKDSSKIWDVMVSQGGDSAGGNFSNLTRWLSNFGETDKDPILGDFNADGLTDIGYVEKESGQWVIKYALSDGTSFIPDKDADDNDIPYTYPTGISDTLDGTLITGDMNGDGLFDVAAFDKTTREWTVSLHHSKYPDLLVEIDNGIGGKTKIEYKDSVMYDNTGADDMPDLPFSVRVVDRVTQKDGLGRAYTTRYFYENGFFEPGMREFRGFGRVEVIDAEGSVKETYFYQDATLKGRPQKEVIKDKYNRIYSETAYNWQTKCPWNDLTDVVVTANETIRGDRNYLSYTVNSGVTVTIDDTSTFYIRDDVTVNGTIQVKQGTFVINATNINVGASGKITTATGTYDIYGKIVLKADSINVATGGIIEEDITDKISGRSTSSSGGNYSADSDVWDNSWSTHYGWYNQGGHTNQTVTSTMTFDPTAITRLVYKIGGWTAPEGGSASGQVQINTGSWQTLSGSYYNVSNGGSATMQAAVTTGWTLTGIKAISSQWDTEDCQKANVYHYTLRIFGAPIPEGTPYEEGPGYIFPYLASKTSTVYDPQDELRTKSTKAEYTYDAYGNITEIKEYGFVAGTVLKKTSITYAAPNTTDWIIGKPATSIIYESDEVAKVAESRYYYDGLALNVAPVKGSLTKEEKWLKDATQDTYIATSFTYDTYGNVKTVTDSLLNTTTTDYEDTYTFPQKVTNALAHAQQFTYDKATGKILTSTDPNGQVTTSTYDGFGRLENVIGPGNISQVDYFYDLNIKPARITTKTVSLRGSGGAADEAISSFTFIDGLGRQILSRVQAEYDGIAKHIVSGEVEYDSRGQVIKKYLPYYIEVPSPEDQYLSPVNTTPHMVYEYDAMGRLIKTVRPDNKTSYIIYDLNKVTSINENNQRITQTKDAFGRIIEIEEADGSITNYEYDTLGNLTDTYDSATPRNHTQIQYDTLGRKISMDDPDMGHWSYQYDEVGNLIEQQDAKGVLGLPLGKQKINFIYDKINRLIKKEYFVYTGRRQGDIIIYGWYSEGDPVDYIYDLNINGKGRLSSVTDPSGTTEFFYDILGREEKTIKTINGSSYEINRTYDSLDRLLTVKYPDTTIVSYTYNKQGGIKTISGGGTNYVESVAYNANGQITHIDYGNGTSTDYTYDPYNFRLDRLVTAKDTTPIQDLSYNFDPVGNVTSILDAVHTNTQHFGYDNLNRLTYANGASYGTIDYAYDSIGNMLTKGDMTMTYGERGHGPHAVTSYVIPAQAGIQIDYDGNGNMKSKGLTDYTYDAENRLTKVMRPQGGGEFTISLNLTAGWNFFSIPGNIPNSGGDIATILTPIADKYEQVSRYDDDAGKWQHFVNNRKFNQFDKFTYGEGYLIYMKEAATLDLDGFFPLEQQTKILKDDRWILIFAPTDTTIDKAEALAYVHYDGLKTWNGTAYEDATTLEAGKAYWIHRPDRTGDHYWRPPLPTTTTEYTYDGDGGRVLRVVPAEAGTQGEATLYIGSSFEAQGEPNKDADKITKHIFMGSTRVCSVTDSVIPAEAGIHYYHGDHLGSSNVITDDTGEVVNILEYTPYGLVSRNTGPYSTDKRFTGKTWDSSSSLFYYGARYYDPELGRFITADPTIQRPYDPQDFSRYQYARSNPVRYVDPTGYGWWSSFWNWLSDNWQGIIAVVIMVVSVVVMCIAPYTAPYMLPTFIGQVSGAVVGGMSAARSGGNVGSGMLFGVAAGTVTGGALGAMGQAGYGGSVVGKMAMGAVGGAGAGATSGYAGGKGNIGDIIKSAALGAGTAAIIAGAMGVLQGDPLLPASNATAPGGTSGNVPTKESAAGDSSPGTTSIPKPETPEEALKQTLVVKPKPIPTKTIAPKPGTRGYFERVEYRRARYILESQYNAVKRLSETPVEPPSGGIPESPWGYGGWLVEIGKHQGWF